MPFILGTNSIKDTGFDVANSLRFNDGSSDYLNRTQSTSPTNSKKGTISFWVKRSALGDQHILNGYTDTNNRAFLNFTSDNRLQVGQKNSGTTVYQIQETAQRRDVSAWYNCVFAFDTTDATASNRIKLYVNGSQVTDFTTNNEIEVNEDIKLFNLANLQLGRAGGGSNYFDGYLAEFVYVDGSQLGADSFGEFDSDSPTIWKPKDVSGLTFGTNGFYLDFEDSSALGNDVSGNNNDFTANNLTAADQTPDTCTNNFATLNPLGFAGTIPTFSQGNLNVVVGVGASLYSVPTIGVSSGKWYVEGELEAATINSGTYYVDYGFHDRTDSLGQSLYVSDGRMFWLSSWDGKINYRTGGSTTTGLVTGLATLTPGDFFQLYLDMDNELMYWGKNGSLLNSTGVSFNGKESLTGEYFFAFGDQYTNGSHEYAVNFGQGSIDGTAVSNYNDANGYGNFKYNPTVTTDEGSKDFLALCTKNLAEYG